MTYRNPPLLADRLEQSSSKTSALPHNRANQENIAHDEQGEAIQTEVNAPGKGFLINRNFAWLASGQAISNLGDFVYSTMLLIWVFTLTGGTPSIFLKSLCYFTLAAAASYEWKSDFKTCE